MKKFYWDLESSPLDDEQLNKMMPELAAASNVKDPAKIAAQIEEKKKDWLDKAALKAITGKIVAVAMAKDDAEPILIASLTDEKGLIDVILRELNNVISTNASAYAWNGSGFDLTFLCQRAAVHGIPAFKDLTQQRGARFSWNENLIDPKLVWSNYSPDHTGTSLKSVALALGVGEKSGSGKDFAELLKTNPDEAAIYAKNDVNLLRKIANRMGL